MTLVRDIDLKDIKGQEVVKRALEVGAVSKASILITGPTSTGKTMLSRAYASFLGGNVFEMSVTDTMQELKSAEADNVGLIIVNDLPIHSLNVLYYLKEIAQTGQIPIIANMTHCACGNQESMQPCSCSLDDMVRYRSRVPASIKEAFDIHIETSRIKTQDLTCSNRQYEPSDAVCKRVLEAEKALSAVADTMDAAAERLLQTAVEKLHITAQTLDRSKKLARSIAALDHSASIKVTHISEAMQYRPRY